MRIAFYKMERTRTVKNVAPEAIDGLMNLEDVEFLDSVDGVLLDNYLLAIGDNYLIAKETYVNCWTSCYTLIYGNPDKIQTIWSKFTEGREDEE